MSPSAHTSFALLANASSLPWTDVPEWPAADFVRATAAELDRGARLCSWFGVPDDGGVRLVAIVALTRTTPWPPAAACLSRENIPP